MRSCVQPPMRRFDPGRSWAETRVSFVAVRAEGDRPRHADDWLGAQLLSQLRAARGVLDQHRLRLEPSRKLRHLPAQIGEVERGAVDGSFFDEMQSRLDEAGYTLSVVTTGYDLSVEPSRVRQLIARGVDALILVGALHAEETEARIERHAIPRIDIWAWLPESPHVQIGFCNRTATRSVAVQAAHVCSLGHRRIGLILGSVSGNDRAAMCLRGVKEGLADAGLALDLDLAVTADFGIEEGARAFLELMGGRKPPTAVICTSDIFAFGALREARRLGLELPTDVSITGFDDSEFAEITTPALTTVRTPRRLMATRCAHAILGLLTGGREMASLKLNTELVVRGSTSPRKLCPGNRHSEE